MRFALALIISLLACSVSAQDFLGGGCERGYVYKWIQHGDVSYPDCVPDPKYWNPPPDGHNPIWAASSYKRWTRIDSLWTFQIVETCDTVEVWKTIYMPKPITVRAVGDISCRQDTVWVAKEDDNGK